MSFRSETTVRVPPVPTDKTPMHRRELRNLRATSSHFALPHISSTVSGDLLFELRGTNWQMNLILDVSGHGARTETYAPLVSQMVVETLTEFSSAKPSPAAILQAIERKITGIPMEKSIVDEMYMSGTCAVIDLENRELTYANAGHPPILYYDASKRKDPGNKLREVENVGDNARPMMFDGFRPNDFGEKKMRINEGDILMLYTDGIFDFFIKRKLNPTLLTDAIAENAGKPVSKMMAEVEKELGKVAPVEAIRETDDLTFHLIKLTS